MTQKVSEFLKENTRDLHDAVEAKFQSRKIFEQSFQIKDYVRLLSMNYALHRQFEEKMYDLLPKALRDDLQPEIRKKLHLLEQDLIDFPDNQKFEDQTISIQNEAEALGILYVMEGSSLGGNVIKKHLSRNAEFGDFEFHYFGCYGEKTGENWKRFLEILNAAVPETKFEDALNGAKKAYGFLLDM